MGKKQRIILLGSYLGISLAGHIMLMSAFGDLGVLDFGMPVSALERIEVDLKALPVPDASTKASPLQKLHTASPTEQRMTIPAGIETAQAVIAPELVKQSDVISQSASDLRTSDEETPTISNKQPAFVSDSPLRTSGEFLGTNHEKLVYRISLLGMPVGSAQLEASNKLGELRIITSIRSNSLMSTLYPVNDSTDTRLINGRYLLTRIRQQEGSLVSDTGFNLMFQERKIFWVDRLKKSSSTEPLEHLDTLDIISGFYFIRLQPLTIGKTLTLRLYDGDKSSLVPVEIIRREKLSLPGMRSADTLVIKPTFSENGFFKNNRDILIWLTDDENRVPVRIEATTPVGRIAAELVSSERINRLEEKQGTSPIFSVDPS